MVDRVTRELSQNVLVLRDGGPMRTRLICALEEADVYEEDGRAVLRTRTEGSPRLRYLLDPDADLYSLLCCTEQSILRRPFEIHMPAMPSEPLSREFVGPTLVVPIDAYEPMGRDDITVAVQMPSEDIAIPEGVSEVHVELPTNGEMPECWPSTSIPIVAILPLNTSLAGDALTPIMHAMGTGRIPFRELRVRVSPRAYLEREQRPPFLSEVIEVVASAAGCDTVSLMRELALRGRLMEKGIRRHLVPDPAFVTWVFRGHRVRGLVPATDHFPVPRRSSRREILRGTPESERDRLLSYLGLLEDTTCRAQSLAQRNLFAVSVHFMDNPDVPLPSPHGGITSWTGGELSSYGI
jgi:hypothetical protein